MMLDVVHALVDLDQQTPSFLKIEALRYGSAVDLEVAQSELPSAPGLDGEQAPPFCPAQEARLTAIRTLRTQGDPRASQLLKEILRLAAEHDMAS